MSYLSLSRNVGESIIVTIPPSDQPQQISIMLSQTRGQRGKIAIKADPSIRIRRAELIDLGPAKPCEVQS